MPLQKDSVGIIVGRFQVDKLHDGHRSLIARVAENHDHVLVMIGTTVTRGTDSNPLDYATRRELFRAPGLVGEGKHIYTMSIADHPSDVEWSAQLDASVGYACQGSDGVLYGSRDSFIKYYSGKYPTVILDAVDAPSGTAIREQIGISPRYTEDFRAGVIYASQQQYPTSYQTVDVAIFAPRDRNGYFGKVLLGRKRGETLWRFAGGFVDPTDESLESAAKREPKEETGLDVTRVEYLGSFRVTDPRYARDKHKIMTAFFLAEGEPGQEKAGDDLEEVRWFDEIPLSLIAPFHLTLAHRAIAAVANINAGRKP
jgi:bifunctional NMN adenylyltransferase/nudix hydrolase